MNVPAEGGTRIQNADYLNEKHYRFVGEESNN